MTILIVFCVILIIVGVIVYYVDNAVSVNGKNVKHDVSEDVAYKEKNNRDDAVDIYSLKDFVAIDFETSNNNRMACQLGVTVVENLEIKESHSWLIQPPFNEYDNHCIAIHGITPKDTENEKNLKELWDEIYPYLKNRTLVAHNASFDSDVLKKNTDLYGLDCSDIKNFICTYKLTGLSLENCCNVYGIDCKRHHDAEFDSTCCAKILINIINKTEADNSKIITKTNEEKNKNYFEKLYEGHEKITGDVLKKDLSNADPSNMFYNKKVVITGTFPIDRKEIALRLKEMGADVDTGITVRTDFVVVGENAGWKKMEKVGKIQNQGGKVKIIYWDEISSIIN